MALASLVHAAAPIVCGAGRCDTPLSGIASFQLNVSVAPTCTTPPDPYNLDYDDGDGEVQQGAVKCQKKGLAASVVSYDCSFTDASKIKPSGSLSGTVCGIKTPVTLTVGDAEEVKPTTEDSQRSLGFLTADLWSRALRDLGLPLAGHRLGQYYDQRRDVAVLFFDAEGNPYFPLPDTIDEDDEIFVAIIDYESRLTGAKVTLSGCNRPPVKPRIQGALSSVLGRTVGTAEIAKPQIGAIYRHFGKCEGADTGGPQLSIQRGEQTSTATVQVNQLFRLAVGLSFGYDATKVNSFAVRAPAGSSVTRVAESTDRLGVTPLVFVSFYPIARDFRKTKFFQVQRFQFVVGMDTENFADNIVVGGGYELTMGLNAIVGWRAITKQRVLAEGSGLKNGSVFDGTTDTLPLRDRWSTGSVFVGLGLNDDLLSRVK
jgi:hypothetical protein